MMGDADADTPMMMLNQPHNVGGMMSEWGDADDDAGRSNNVFSNELAKP